MADFSYIDLEQMPESLKNAIEKLDELLVDRKARALMERVNELNLIPYLEDILSDLYMTADLIAG